MGIIGGFIAGLFLGLFKPIMDWWRGKAEKQRIEQAMAEKKEKERLEAEYAAIDQQQPPASVEEIQEKLNDIFKRHGR